MAIICACNGDALQVVSVNISPMVNDVCLDIVLLLSLQIREGLSEKLK